MKTKSIAILSGIALIPLSASADFMDQMRVHQELGYARAAVSACASLKLNSKGVLALVSRLDGPDQAAVAGNELLTKNYEMESANLFEMLGDQSCAAAKDYERKLKIDLFTEVQ
ncbi:hypothetical protein N9K16_05570 [Alphaproteobacteria bacterium]|nr:hypothetical protein [Alphaproteobacteria bacterium]